jgi:hypothetical protein
MQAGQGSASPAGARERFGGRVDGGEAWTGTYATHTFWPGGVYEVVNGTYTQGLITTPDFIDILDVTINGYSGSAICL